MRQINLLPEENQKKEILRILLKSVGQILLPLIAGMIFIHFAVVLKLNDLEKAARLPEGNREPAQIQQIRKEIGEMKLRGQKFVDAQKDLIENFIVNPPCSRILTNAGNEAMQKVWLTDFNLNLPKRICEISGRSYNIRLVSEFMLELKKLAYFKSVELVNMEESKDKKQEEAMSFKILCGLK